VAYALFDGLFQHALISHLAGNADAAADLEENVQRLLDAVVARGSTPLSRGQAPGPHGPDHPMA
jgi:hypothetical protein